MPPKQVGVDHDVEKLDKRTGRPTHITFEPGANEPGLIPQTTSGIGHRRSRRSRSRSRDSVNSHHSSTSGIPIDFRTLSIQVSESQGVTSEELKENDIKKSVKSSKAEDHDYFTKLDFHLLSPEQICRQLNVSFDQGLSASSASTRLQHNGKNVIAQRRENYWRRVLGYVFGGFCSVLWIGVIIFFLCWRPLSSPPSITNLALAILVIIVIFLQASFSAFQDWSTRRVMNSILALLPSEALVLRDGELVKISAADLVVGDIVQISIGNKVPADLRLLESSGDIRFDRSVLTGESDEIDGAIDSTNQNFLETRNIALMGTNVTNGNGVGIVILTGGRSVMGRIAKVSTGVKDKPTLIQREIARFVKIIVCLTIILASLILFTWVGWLHTDHPSFMNIVAMLNDVMGCVVAFIPEGMPIGVALTLMMIARRMKAAHVLPKGLSTVETLGCVNVMCSDKTGTLTKNRMSVKSVGLVDQEFELNEFSEAFQQEKTPRPFIELHRGSILCNDASFTPTTLNQPADERHTHGNSTDGAVLRFAEAVKPGKSVLQENTRLFQIPFNSKNKWMLTLHGTLNTHSGENSATQPYLIYVKGAPDVLLPKCGSYWSGKTNDVQPLTDSARQSLVTFQEKLSRRAERVILLCQRYYTPREALHSNYFTDEIVNECLRQLTVVGVFGIIDPPRLETAQTVASCRRAGIRFFMVTGDFGLTAAAIAKDIGIFTGNGGPDLVQHLNSRHESPEENQTMERTGRSLLVEGSQMHFLSQSDWDEICQYEEIVFARTTPDQV
jgi:sodium/potassium-transporting ATPase subunit alpha